MTSSGKKRKVKVGIIMLVAILFLVGVIGTAILTYFLQLSSSDRNIKAQMESTASEIAEEVMLYVREYPSYKWLLDYWYMHDHELDIEYDSDFTNNSVTEQKCQQFNEHNPGLQLRYIRPDDVEKLSPEDQKLFAEIVYSWLITRIDQIKQTYKVDFLFCVLANNSYNEMYYLFSAADKGAKRGTDYLDVYPIGTVTEATENLARAMESAESNNSYLAEAGDYVDYYVYFDQICGQPAFMGVSYNLTELNRSIHSQTIQYTFFDVMRLLILAVVCLLLLYFFVLRPLQKIQNSIATYKETKNSEQLRNNLADVGSHNEIKQLAEGISEMSVVIDDFIETNAAITAENERIETELSVGARIQASTLPNVFPPFPDRHEFEIFASMDPAKEVGGDFYDFYLTDDDHLTFLIADVAGKGVPAALFMMGGLIHFYNAAITKGSTAESMKMVNNSISQHNPENMFITVWLGVLEISTGRLFACNAGHEYPILKKPDGSYEIYKDKHDFVVGAMSGIEYHEYVIQLEPGSQIFLYTDGLPEASDADKNMFGINRVVEVLNCDPGLAPEEAIKNMKSAVADFVQETEQFDDLTMLSLKYLGSDKK